MSSGVATVENSRRLPKRLSMEPHMTRHVHSRAYAQETGNTHLPRNPCASITEARFTTVKRRNDQAASSRDRRTER